MKPGQKAVIGRKIQPADVEQSDQAGHLALLARKLGFGTRDLAIDFVADFQNFLSGGGQTEIPAGAADEFLAHAVLKSLERQTDRRLGQMDLCGGPTDTALLDDDAEGPQQVPVQPIRQTVSQIVGAQGVGHGGKP